jgi:hypothetical protein
MSTEFVPYLPFMTILISVLGFGMLILKSLAENREKLIDLLQDHENKDEQRYLETLRRFEKVSVALAKLGSDNGTADH